MEQSFAGKSLKKRIIMGVINLSPETFYKSSLVRGSDDAGERARKMVDDGADIIDLGAMSTGPGVDPISKEEEKRRLLPAVKAVREEIENPISIDTQRSEVARDALESGADIINDVSGLKADPEMVNVLAKYDCYAILMANKITGRLRTAEKEENDIDSMKKVKEALRKSLQICEETDVDPERITVDPSIGFGRPPEKDLEILGRLEELLELERPICIGVSRKSFIGEVLDLDRPKERLSGSLGATAVAIMKGASIIRTHDPQETSEAVKIVEAIEETE